MVPAQQLCPHRCLQDKQRWLTSSMCWATHPILSLITRLLGAGSRKAGPHTLEYTSATLAHHPPGDAPTRLATWLSQAAPMQQGWPWHHVGCTAQCCTGPLPWHTNPQTLRLCGLAGHRAGHLKALRAVRLAQAAQLPRRARRHNGAFGICRRVPRLCIRLLRQTGGNKC